MSDGAGGYHFLTHEGDADRLSRTAVGEHEIRQALASLKGRAVMFADTCHAGNVIGTGAAVGREIGRVGVGKTRPENARVQAESAGLGGVHAADIAQAVAVPGVAGGRHFQRAEARARADGVRDQHIQRRADDGVGGLKRGSTIAMTLRA